MNDRPDPLDRELARLRDDLHTEARRVAHTDDALADVRAGVAVVTPLPRRRPLWLAGAVVVATAAAVAGVVVLTRDDRDAVTVPVTDPATVTTLPDTTAFPDTTPASTQPPTGEPATTAFIDPAIRVDRASVSNVRSLAYRAATGGWAIVELDDGRTVLIRSTNFDYWAIAAAPADPASLSQVTFADAQNGWLVGAQHWWSTHDGGATWNELPTSESGDAPLEVVVAGGWALIVRAEPTSDGPFAVRVWRSPVGRDDFRPTDALVPKGAGGNDVTLSAVFDGTDVVVALNDRGGTTMRLHDDGSAEGLGNPAIARGGDIALQSAPSGGAVWVISRTGDWGGDATPQQVVAVSSEHGAPFVDVTLPEPVDVNSADGPRLCGLAQFDDGSTALVLCDAQGARQYRSTDLGRSWDLLGSVVNGDGTGEWSWGSVPSSPGTMVLSVGHTDAGGTSEGIWTITSSTESWISLFGN